MQVLFGLVTQSSVKASREETFVNVFKSILGVSAQGFAQRSSAVRRKKQWSGLHGSAPVGRYGAARVSSFKLCTAIQHMNCPLFSEI